jgi:hypothetical protein
MWLGRMKRLSTREMSSEQATTIGQDGEEVADLALDQREGHEGADGGEDGRDDGPADLVSAVDGGEEGGLALLVAGGDVLGDDDGVVDEDADDDDEAEHAEQVQADIGDAHHDASVPMRLTMRPAATQKLTRQLSRMTSVAKTRTPPQKALRVSSSRRPTTKRARSVVVVRVPGRISEDLLWPRR